MKQDGGTSSAKGRQDEEPGLHAPKWKASGAKAERDRVDDTAQSPNADMGGEKDYERVPSERGTDRPAGRSRAWWLSLAALLLIALGGAGYYASGRLAPKPAQQAAQDPGVPVQVAEARSTNLPVYLDSLGTVQALNTVVVRTRVEGQITRIAFTEGQMVQEGDLLAQIDPRPYQAALDQAVAKKAQDEATLANTRLDLDRTQRLGEFASRQALDTQRANVGAQSAQIAVDDALIDTARTQLDYATIRAPLAGRTGLRLIDQGNIVRSSDTGGIVEVAQIQPIAVLFTAPEQQLRDIAKAKAVGSVAVTALNSRDGTPLAEGELVLINNQVDAASGTVRLKAQFANAEGHLWPGLSVNTRLRLKVLNGVVTIPADAVMRGPDHLFVFVAKGDGLAEKRKVQVGIISETQAVIESGIWAGEVVVVAGQSRVMDGARLAAKRVDREPNGEARTPGPTASN